MYGIKKMKMMAVTIEEDADYNASKMKGCTYTWAPAAALKAVAKGDTLTIKKLPKAGTYKVKLTAFDSEGNKLCKTTYKIVVKK